ncbi:MAG: hypothetical protein ACLSBN_06410 [Clostridium perfringens]
MNKDIIDVNNNFIYEVIYSVQNKQHGLKFPIDRIEEYLISEGYKKINIESNKFFTVMSKDENKVFVGENVICFEVLSEDLKEKYKQKILSFIILRYKIFSDATIQNIESAKINLIQNKLRTCVSNMYYALHNGISAMVEYYKSINDISNSIESNNDDLDDEAFLGHFTPAAFKVFLENINGICTKEKEDYLRTNDMKCGRMKSINNPFSWIFPLFYGEINSIGDEKNEFEILIENMATAIMDVSLENIAVDDTQKRSNFEKELKQSLEDIKTIINDEEKNSNKYILAVLSGYFSYAYMLRQLGDYDSLFEVKVKQKEVIRWTITSSQFIDIILSYLNIRENENVNKIQIINARSSKETLNDLYVSTNRDLMTITGIIIDRNFRLKNYVKNLLSRQGYSLFNQNYEIPRYDEQSSGIIVSKSIIMTPYKCFITISNVGIFRIDVILSGAIVDSIKNTINTSYLEKFIYKEILEEDFDLSLSNKGRIVVGYPIIYQNENYSKLELLAKTHPKIERDFSRILSNMADDIADNLWDNKNLIIPGVELFRDNNEFIRFTTGYGIKLRRKLENLENNNIKVIIIIISNSEVIISEERKERFIRSLKNRVENDNNIIIECIKISDDILKQTLCGEQTFLKNSFKNIIEEDSGCILENEDSNLENDEYDEIKEIDDFEEVAVDIVENIK